MTITLPSGVGGGGLDPHVWIDADVQCRVGLVQDVADGLPAHAGLALRAQLLELLWAKDHAGTAKELQQQQQGTEHQHCEHVHSHKRLHFGHIGFLFNWVTFAAMQH